MRIALVSGELNVMGHILNDLYTDLQLSLTRLYITLHNRISSSSSILLTDIYKG